MIIVFDGIDGCGKSTHARHTFYHVVSKGYDAIFLKEPTEESPAGVLIKDSIRSGKRMEPEEELRLFVEDRRWDVENRIIPAINSGKIVVMDRYYYSTIAYQGALGIDIERIKEMNSFAPRPDIAFILDIEPKEALRRLHHRKEKDYFEKEEYLKKVREIFLSMETMPEVRIIDSSREINKVRMEIFSEIDRVIHA